MGEIVGGIIVMGLFIMFVIWKNKGKNKKYDPIRDMHEQEYWAQKEAEEHSIVSSDDDDSD